MPFDDQLAERLRRLVKKSFGDQAGLAETRMFGGFGYLLHGNMCLGIHKDTLMLRVGVEAAEKLLTEAHIRPMNLTGKVMKGWVTVEPEGMAKDRDLARVCKYAIKFVAGLPPKG